SVFFVQAEDGIRDRNVTGVQTCALPIFRLKGNPAEIPVKLHLCMGIPIFILLYGRKLLIGNRESHSLPDNCQQGLGRFFIGIPEIGRASCREGGSWSVAGGREAGTRGT